MKLALKCRLGERGLIKAFLLITLVLCGLFMMLFIIGKSSGDLKSSGAGYSNPVAGNNTSKSNPLLSFLDAIPSSSGSGGNISNSSLGLGSGNASYEVQTYSEYITIRNSGKSSVNLTGYTLTNAKGARPIETSQNTNITNVTPDRSVIPKGTKYLSPDAKYTLQDIILEPGGTAYIITGGPFTAYTIPISVSFQDNKCEGYLSKTYPFTPYLSNSCPRIHEEAGAESVSIQCYDYLKTVYSCTDAKKEDKARYDAQTFICQSFVDKVANYQGCYNRHVGDSNFLSKDWRIFMGRPREMWASRDESIRLYDRAGKIVGQISY